MNRKYEIWSKSSALSGVISYFQRANRIIWPQKKTFSFSRPTHKLKGVQLKNISKNLTPHLRWVLMSHNSLVSLYDTVIQESTKKFQSMGWLFLTCYNPGVSSIDILIWGDEKCSSCLWWSCWPTKEGKKYLIFETFDHHL